MHAKEGSTDNRFGWGWWDRFWQATALAVILVTLSAGFYRLLCAG